MISCFISDMKRGCFKTEHHHRGFIFYRTDTQHLFTSSLSRRMFYNLVDQGAGFYHYQSGDQCQYCTFYILIICIYLPMLGAKDVHNVLLTVTHENVC